MKHWLSTFRRGGHRLGAIGASVAIALALALSLAGHAASTTAATDPAQPQVSRAAAAPGPLDAVRGWFSADSAQPELLPPKPARPLIRATVAT